MVRQGRGWLAPAAGRLASVDNLEVAVLTTVVVVHAATTHLADVATATTTASARPRSWRGWAAVGTLSPAPTATASPSARPRGSHGGAGALCPVAPAALASLRRHGWACSPRNRSPTRTARLIGVDLQDLGRPLLAGLTLDERPCRRPVSVPPVRARRETRGLAVPTPSDRDFRSPQRHDLRPYCPGALSVQHEHEQRVDRAAQRSGGTSGQRSL